MYWFRNISSSATAYSVLSIAKKSTVLLFSLFLFSTCMLTSSAYAAPLPEAQVTNRGARFNGQDNYVAFGDAHELRLSEFTLELWFKWDGAGITTSTGVGGVEAYPLLAKGRGQAGQNVADVNYFLGIDGQDNVLVADFTEGENGYLPGDNHPIFGKTALEEGEWYHAAATYDGHQWQLFLNGQLESWIIVGQPTNASSQQQVSLATTLNAVGEPEGYFAGTLDEVRIWDKALRKEVLRAHINSELRGPQSHLVARWSLDDVMDGVVADSAGLLLDGTAVAKSSSGQGAPFNLAPNDAPNMPVLVQPADTAVDVSTSPTLEVAVTDPEAEPMTVRFYGRPLPIASDDFTLIALPDTQKYAASYHDIFNAQTQWVVDNKATRNIAHVSQLGDCVDNGGSTSQWDAADTAFSYLEDPATTGLPDGIPYSIAVGNRDQKPAENPNGDSTALYNQYFGISRFNGRSYYGGHFGSNFDNHYELFSASGMNFILISLEYGGATQPVLDWADNLLATYSERRAIVVTHYMLNTNGSFSSQGQDIYDALKDRPNLFLLLGGHRPGEGRRQDDYNGHKVHSLLADYQSRTNGGNGWLRILEFSPNHNEIRVKTYSPTLDQFETDSDSEFVLEYGMQQSPGAAEFELIGELSDVPSGSNGSITWPNLAYSTAYEWYVTVSDGSSTVTGPYWRFTTGTQPPAPQAQFSADSTAGDVPLTVNFTDLSTNAPTSWSWDFGDGNFSDEQNPSHIYNTPGIYSISLTVANDGGSDQLTKTDYIDVGSPPVPVAYFTQTTYMVSESGGETVMVDVALSHASSNALTVNYSTSDATAVAPADYLPNSGTLTFAPGETSKTIAVTIVDDNVDELDEQLLVTLSGAIVTEPSQAIITITDNDPLPELFFMPVLIAVVENDATAAVEVMLDGTSDRIVTVDYATVAATAVADQDYTAVTGTLTFNPGEQKKTVLIGLLDDIVDEPQESLTVQLQSPVNAVLGSDNEATVAIEDDDPPVSIAFAQAASVQSEESGTVVIDVILDAVSDQVVTVNYGTGEGTAVAGSDYETATGQLTFAPGEISKQIVVQLLADVLSEEDETVIIELSDPVNATISTPGSITITIIDNDSYTLFLPMLISTIRNGT